MCGRETRADQGFYDNRQPRWPHTVESLVRDGDTGWRVEMPLFATVPVPNRPKLSDSLVNNPSRLTGHFVTGGHSELLQIVAEQKYSQLARKLIEPIRLANGSQSTILGYGKYVHYGMTPARSCSARVCPKLHHNFTNHPSRRMLQSRCAKLCVLTHCVTLRNLPLSSFDVRSNTPTSPTGRTMCPPFSLSSCNHTIPRWTRTRLFELYGCST